MASDDSNTNEQKPERDASELLEEGSRDAGEPRTLSIFFLAAALGLTLLLSVIGMLAFAAMSNMPLPPASP